MKIVQLLAVLALVTASGPLRATQKVDSLLHLLETHTAIDRAEVLWAVAYELFDYDNPKAHFYAERAFNEVWKKGDSLQIVKVGTTYAQLERRMGNLDRAVKIGEDLLYIARRNDYKFHIKKLLNVLGSIHVSKERFDNALSCYYESLRLRREDGDSSELALAFMNIGFVHYKLGDHEISLEYTKDAIKWFNARRDSATIMGCYNNLAANYRDMKDIRRAKSYYFKAISYDKQLLDEGITSSLNVGLAMTYLDEGNLDSAQYFSQLSLESGKRMRDQWSVVLAYLTLSDIWLIREEISRSQTYLTRADSIARVSAYPFLKLLVLKHKGNFLTKIGKTVDALATVNLYWSRNDSIFHGATRARIKDIQIQNAQRENELKLQSQASILALKDESLEQHRRMLVIITALLMLVAVMAFELYRAYRKKANINKLLDLRVVERTQELGRQRDYLQHRVDEERINKQRIFSEVQAQLNTLKGLLHLVEKDPGRSQAIYLTNANDVTNQIADTVRRLTIDMRNEGQFPGQ